MDSSHDVPTLPPEAQHAELLPADENKNGHGTRLGDCENNLVRLQETIDFTLNFLSTSSNEALVGVFACLMGATYVVLGRIGLLLIGIITGIILHATWEGTHDESGNAANVRNSAKRRELALRIANRLLDLQPRDSFDPQLNSNRTHDIRRLSTTQLDYSSFRPETAAAMRSLTDAVIKDYVDFWYKPILPSETSFPMSCRKTLAAFIHAISSHLARKRTADTFLEFLTNSSSMIIVFLNEISTALEDSDTSQALEQVVQRYLEAHPDSSLANVLATQQQHKKLNLIADDVLSSFLDQKTYDCSPVREFLREILAGVVLGSTITSLSRPEFINGWIIYLFSEGSSEIMSAIDAGVESAQNQGVTNKISKTPLEHSEMVFKDSVETVQQSNEHKDRATEQAMKEVKRLSNMMAAQDVRGRNSEDIHRRDSLVDPPVNGIGCATHESVKESTGDSELSPEMSTIDPVINDQQSSPSSTQRNRPPINNLSSHASALQGASISLDDGSEPGEKAFIRSKPTFNYLLQVEPVSSRSTGWMIFRKYSDFESLHETLEATSRINGIKHFVNEHPILPPWKGRTKHALARDLERYLQDALQSETLAECDRMRRFLDKDGSLGPESRNASTKPGFSFPSQAAFENVGKGVLGALTNAPKGVSDGSKAVFGGVTGVFGGATGKIIPSGEVAASRRQSAEVQQPYETEVTKEHEASLMSGKNGISSPLFDQSNSSPEPSSLMSLKEVAPCKDELNVGNNSVAVADQSESGTSCRSEVSRSDGRSEGPHEAKQAVNMAADVGNIHGDQSTSLTQEETRIAVELIFAVINELYTLSSAWNIRRTLLNAAKSYILRPGNPNLETIRGLLQESIINANMSDQTIGLYINKLRENALPTEEELKSWPPPASESEKERLRKTARRLLVQRGLPQALTSVMGAAASREALEKIFDCLQVESVARGFVYAVLLQGLRAVLL